MRNNFCSLRKRIIVPKINKLKFIISFEDKMTKIEDKFKTDSFLKLCFITLTWFSNGSMQLLWEDHTKSIIPRRIIFLPLRTSSIPSTLEAEILIFCNNPYHVFVWRCSVNQISAGISMIDWLIVKNNKFARRCFHSNCYKVVSRSINIVLSSCTFAQRGVGSVSFEFSSYLVCNISTGFSTWHSSGINSNFSRSPNCEGCTLCSQPLACNILFDLIIR